MISLSGISNLEYLLIQNVKLSNTTFVGLSLLERLVIDNCDFTNITNDSFKRLTNVEYLSISYPQNYSHVTYTGMPHLKWLLIEGVKSIHQSDLSTNLSLNVIQFKNCFVDSNENLSEVLGELKHSSLKALDFEDNSFPDFETKCLSGFTALQTLKIEKSEVKTIKFSENLSNLHSLSLVNNVLKTFDSSISLLKELSSLYLSNNYLQSTPDMFMGLESLVRLDLSFNRGLGEIHIDMFCGLSNLLELNMSYCALDRIHSDAFSHLPKLAKLKLSSNTLKLDNAGVLRHLTQLKELDLSQNKLQYFNIEQGMFSNLVSLEVLNLTQNHISKLRPNMFKDQTNLRVLEMGGNWLKEFELAAVSGLARIEKIELSIGNSNWKKEKELKDFFKSKIKFLDRYDVYDSY